MIVCLGDLLLDVLVSRVAGHGGESVPRDLAVRPGGSAANTAAWLAALGKRAGFVGAAGIDLEGDLLVEDLHRRGVSCAVSRHREAASGTLLLETQPEGALRPMSQRGANDLLDLADPEQQQLLATAGWLHLSAYAFYAKCSRQPVLDAVAAARARGIRVSLDLGAPHLVWHIGEANYRALLHATEPDVLFANGQEAGLLAAGGDPLAVLAGYAPCAVLKLGQAGCTVRLGDQQYNVSAIPATIMDPTGAGDAFVAGFIGTLYEGSDARAAAGAGADAGARCVTMMGGRPQLLEYMYAR